MVMQTFVIVSKQNSVQWNEWLVAYSITIDW